MVLREVEPVNPLQILEIIGIAGVENSKTLRFLKGQLSDDP